MALMLLLVFWADFTSPSELKDTHLEWRIFASLTNLRRLCQYVIYEKRHKRDIKDDLKVFFWSYLRPIRAALETT